MTNNFTKIESWIITKQPKGLTALKEPYIPIDGRWFCSLNRQEMEIEAKRLNDQVDGWMYLLDPQS